MDELFTFESIGKFFGFLSGGGVITALWTWRADRLAQYGYLDEMYTDLLAEYREHPEYGDKSKTTDFANQFTGKEELAYHYFAMSVMNVMETMFDVLRGKPLKNRHWAHVFMHHVGLHYPWLKANADAFEDQFVAYAAKVRDGRSRGGARRAA